MTVDDIVMYSGGVTSWATAQRLAEHPREGRLRLVFADTLIEDPDLYRFLEESAALTGGELLRLAEGRTPWEVFDDVKLMGNTHHDPCSRVLKREFLRKWLKEEYPDPKGVRIHLGYDWTEIDRLNKAKRYWDPYEVDCPLMWRPTLVKAECNAWARLLGLEIPELNRRGFPHNNCGGFCVKAGHAGFRLLLQEHRGRYLEHERAELSWRFKHGKDYAILRDRRGGDTLPLTMKTFRERIEAGEELDPQLELDWGGCGCFDP
jgi:hypothetical protein